MVAWFERETKLAANMLDRQPPGTARLLLTNLTESKNVSCVASSAMGQATHFVTIMVKRLPATPGSPRVLRQSRFGKVTLAFAKSLDHATESSSTTAAPDIVAYVIPWIESRYFLPDYLDSLSTDIANAIQGVISGDTSPLPHLPGATETTIADAYNQVGLRFRLISISEIKNEASNVEFQLTGLKPFVNYTVWCRSVNAKGDVSPASNPVNFITDQEVPSSPPRSVQANAISNAAVSVSWEQPLQANGPITMYRVYYTEDAQVPLAKWNSKLVQVESALNSPHLNENASILTLLTHLHSNATYYICVSASNIKGNGPTSSPYAVIVRPGALPPPLDFKAVSKSAYEVSLHWKTPETKQRDFPLVNYELLITPLDGEGNTEISTQKLFIESSLNSFLVNTLLPNTIYEFRLAAVSETGAGIPTETTAKTKKYVPGPPNRVNVKATGGDRLQVTWAPPKDSISPSLLAHMGKRANELRIVYYDIDVRPTDASGNWLTGPLHGVADHQRQMRLQFTSERKIEEARGKLVYSREIASLLPGNHYVVHIRAVSRSGSGDRAKSNPTKTWPLRPNRPMGLELRVLMSPTSRHRILQAHWKPPLQKTVPMGGFKYRVRWKLLIAPENVVSFQGNQFGNTHSELIALQRARELGVAEELLGGEENVTKLTWDSPEGKLLGGLAYEVKVATMDEYQTGTDVVEKIEFPDDAPSLPPSGIRIDTSSPYLLLQWKAPPLKSRNGRLLTYEAECSWVDMTKGFKETWQTKSVKIVPIDPLPSTLFWPSGHISLLNISASTDASVGTVYRSRVRAWTSAGEGPWSEFESLSLKYLVPKEPTSVNAIDMEQNGVLVTWAMPEGLIQTSYEGAKVRSELEARVPIYRQFVIEYGINKGSSLQSVQWKSSKTLGPQTGVTLPIFRNADQHIVRVQSIGIANLHSNFSVPVLIQKVLLTNAQAVESLKCQPTAKNANNVELELSWNLNGLPSPLKITHYLVNYTSERVYLNEDGDLIRESQGEREQSLRSSEASVGTIVQRIIGLSFNTAYRFDVLPVFEPSITATSFGKTKSVFCRTPSKPSHFVRTPEFHPSQHGAAAFIIIYRVNEQNGTVATYEILAKEAGSSSETQAAMVLAQFSAITLFRQRTKAARVVLNGSTNANLDGGSEIYYAPPLIPGRSYNIALRVCVEPSIGMQLYSHQSRVAIDPEIDFHGNEASSPTSLCSTSDWSESETRMSSTSRVMHASPKTLFALERDDPLWPAIVRENMSAIATSIQTPFNDAGIISRLEEQELSVFKLNSPSADAITRVTQPVLPNTSTLNAGFADSDRIHIIIAALSILVGIGMFAFICFLIVRHLQRRGNRPHQNRKGCTVKPLAPKLKGNAAVSSVAASLSRYEPTISGRGLLSSDELSLNSELLGTASLCRFGDVNRATIMSMEGNCICSTPTIGTETAASFDVLSTILNARHPPPPPPYFMNPPPALTPDMLMNDEASDQVISQPVTLDDLAAHVKHLKENHGLLLSAGFETIDPGGQFTWEHSSRPANRPKNRYANVVTYDHSRVVLIPLDGDPDSDYINANFLDGFNRKRAYIATQGPLQNTVCDFWRMVWEQRSSTIVAMTQLEERERVKCEQYWPASGLSSSAGLGPTKNTDWLLPRPSPIALSESAPAIGATFVSPIATTTYGQIIVSLIEVVELAYFTVRTFTVQKSGCRERREIRQLQFTAWPDHGVPNHPAPLLMFLRRVNAEFVPDVGPIIVHCSAGVGRTGAYIVLDILLQQMHHENAVNVLAVVTQLRSQRNFVVQTVEQYAFIYEALVEATLSGNTELPARKLRHHWHKLIVPCCPKEEAITTQPPESDFDPLENTGVALEFGQLLSQTTGPIAELIAHNSVGGLVVFNENLTESSEEVLSGSLPVNIPKNRCGKSCIPYESNRVKLSSIRGVEGSDYINASYIDSYLMRSAFIATQTPIVPFLDDFWRMVWESGSTIIVNMDQSEPSYWPNEESARYGLLVGEPLASYDMNAYVLRELRLTDAKNGHSRIIRLFEASHLSLLIKRTIASARIVHRFDTNDITMPPSLPPLAEWMPNRSSAINTSTFEFINGGTHCYRSASTDSNKRSVFDDLICQKAALGLIDLLEQVRKAQGQFGLKGPITVHCRNGTGYSGIFLMLSSLFERMRIEGVLDAFQATKLLWWQRRGLVETHTEYAFCYATALEYLNLYESHSIHQLNPQTPCRTLF